MSQTPSELWNGFDLKLRNFESSVLKTKTEKFKEKTLYFNGDKGQSAAPRIYARFCTPLERADNDRNFPVIVVMEDASVMIENFDVTPYINEGYGVFIVDYAGYSDSRERFTIYPKSQGYCNYFYIKDFNQVPEVLTQSCWYVWTTVLLRAYSFIEDMGFSSIAFLGIGTGGVQAYKMGMLAPKAAAVVTLFSYGYEEFNNTSSDSNVLNFKMCMQNESYGNFISVPTLMQITSNEQTNSLNKMCELYKTANSKCVLSISPFSNLSFELAQMNNIFNFFRTYFKKPDTLLPLPALIEAKSSENHLYYEINPQGEPESISLFVASGKNKSSSLNWKKVTPQKVGNIYLAKVDIFDVSAPLHAFCNLSYEFINISTPVITKTPAFMEVTGSAFSKSKIIFEGKYSESDFIVLNTRLSLNDNIKMEEYNGISAVYSDKNSLTTFKLGEPRYSGEQNYILQLTLLSKSEQMLKFKAETSNQSFTAIKKVYSDDYFSKISLSSSDFKADVSGSLDWSKVVSFTILSENKLLVGGMLWV